MSSTRTTDPLLKAQLDIRSNALDYQTALKELTAFESDIKEIEEKLTSVKAQDENLLPPPRNVSMKRAKGDNNNIKSGKKRISAYDYQAWDEFVKKESDSDHSSLEDSEDESSKTVADVIDLVSKENDHSNSSKLQSSASALGNIDEAFFEKELGNKLVKEGKWKEASDCYSKSINIDPGNPVYYANRALCHLKLSRFKSAEVDSTVAIQLDKNYLKAYQRRAFARKALQQYVEAKKDFQQVLILEPKNSQAMTEIEKLDVFLSKSSTPVVNVSSSDKKPMFNAKNVFGSATKQALNSLHETKATKNIKEESSNESLLTSTDSEITLWVSKGFESSKDHSFALVKPTLKPTHLRSKKPVNRVAIVDVANFKGFENGLPETQAKRNKNVNIGTEDLQTNISVTAETPECAPHLQLPPAETPECAPHLQLPPTPHTYLQFEKSFKLISGSIMLNYLFLKSIQPQSIPEIFGSSLESDLLSLILMALSSEECLRDSEFLLDFLRGLSEVDRFDTLLLFMCEKDILALKNCFTRLQESLNNDIVEEVRNRFRIF